MKSSWDAYIVGINEEFKAKLKKYRDSRRQLAEMFLTLAEIQRKAKTDFSHVSMLCDSDLTAPETLDKYPKTYTERVPASQAIGMFPGLCPSGLVTTERTEDLLIRALVTTGDLPAEKEQDLVSVVDCGKPVPDPFI